MAQTMGSSYRKGLILSLGSVIQTQVDLYAVVPSSKGTGLHRTCPEHKLQLNQVHRCPEGHDVLPTEWVMAQETSAGLQVAPQTARPQSQADDMLDLKPIARAELEANTFEGPSIYYATPNPASMQAWLALIAIIDKGKVALVAKGSLRAGSEKLWRVDVFRDYLVLREIVFPEDVRNTPERPDAKLDKQTLTLVSQFLESLITSWEKIDTTNRSREQLKSWIEEGETIPLPEVEKTDNVEQFTSLMEKLQEAVKK